MLVTVDRGTAIPTLGQNVRALRKEREWSQDDLVRESGLSKGTIQNIEMGKWAPRMATVLALSDAFHVSPDRIIRGHSAPDDGGQW